MAPGAGRRREPNGRIQSLRVGAKDSELVRAVAVLARAGQDTTWQRQQAGNQLRSILREYFPAAVTAFHVKHLRLASPEARTILAATSTPAAAARL